jgi:DNA-binding NarL/FixJ family response regulator
LIRVIVVDDHPVVLAGLAQILKSEKDVEVVAACSNAGEALAAITANQPDVVVLDLRMPERDGISVLSELSRRDKRPRVILLTALIDQSDVRQVITLGVEGIVLKESAPHMLLEAVRRVAGGDRFLDSPDLLRILKRGAAPAESESAGVLTEREVEIAWKTLQEVSVEEIARSLGITAGAVAIHLDRIERKIGGSVFDKRDALFGPDDLEGAFPVDVRDEAETSVEAKRLQKRFGLTPREAMVGALLAEGLSNKEIATRLSITLNTVKTHIAAVHAKADVTSTRKLLVLLRSGA